MEPNPYESPLASGGYEEEEPPDDGPPTIWDRFGFWVQLGLLLVIGGVLASLMLPPAQFPHPHRRHYTPRPIEQTEEATSAADESEKKSSPAPPTKEEYDAPMRQELAILKYVPTMLCGLLVVAWVMSFQWSLPIVTFSSIGDRIEDLSFALTDGQLMVTYWEIGPGSPQWRLPRSSYLSDGGAAVVFSFIPVYALLLPFLPLGLIPLTRFRFPLWSYFAWTALVAAELAYYLT
jgi:hypothetical protein